MLALPVRSAEIWRLEERRPERRSVPIFQETSRMWVCGQKQFCSDVARDESDVRSFIVLHCVECEPLGAEVCWVSFCLGLSRVELGLG